MAPQTTTGIALAYNHARDAYVLTRPGRLETLFSGESHSLDSIRDAAGLSTNGYWLRAAPKVGVTTWTWVQL